MIKMLEFRPNPRARKLVVTEVGQLCSIRPGIVEMTVVKQKMNPRGILVYDEVGSLEWPIEALIEAHQQVDVALYEFLRRQVWH